MLRRPIAQVYALFVLLPLASHADPPLPGVRTLPLFTIAKSENRNQVQYVVRVDGRCAPLGGTPVFAYWRMLEKGPDRTEPLLDHELPAYGLSAQSVLGQDARSGRVRIALRAVPARPIDVVTWRDDAGECRASATLPIGGATARLFNVYAKLKWPWGVDYLLLQGWSLDGSRVAREFVQQ